MNDFINSINELRPKLVAYCKSRIINKHAAEDIAQDTIFILVKKQNEYNPNRSLSGWAFTICRFQIKAYLTSKSRSPELIQWEFRGNYENSYDKQNLCQDHEHPRRLLLNKEKKAEDINKINRVYSIIGERPSKFLKLYLDGKSRSFIMKELEMSKVSYYSTKLRLIRKARVLMGCKA